MKKATRATAFRFLRENKVAIITTVADNYDLFSRALSYYVSKDNNLRFVTRDRTTTYMNLLANSKVALSVLSSTLRICVNIEGEVRKITDRKVFKESLRELGHSANGVECMPAVFQHQHGDIVVLELHPIKIQYTDFSSNSDSSLSSHIFDL